MDMSNIKASEVVLLINSELSKKPNMTLSKVCQKLDININSVTSKLYNAGYMYSEKERKYVEVYIPPQNLREEGEINEMDNNSVNTPVKTKKAKKGDKKEIVSPLTDEEIILLRQLLNKEKTNTVDNEITVNTEVCKGNVATINMKIYSDTNKRWQKLCKQNEHIRKQDLLTMALNEYINKHLKD